MGQLSNPLIPLSEIESNSPKMKWLMVELGKIKARNDKVILFCELRDVQRLLQRAISERFGFAPAIINGDTSTSSKSTLSRQKQIRGFQEKPGFGAIILSPLAAGFGLNIQAANHVIHFTRTWNPAKEDQATDRAYRIGQSKEVFVYCPLVVAEDFTTFDAKLNALLEWKRGLSGDMLNGVGDVSGNDFGELEAPRGELF
jgi:SNF2 family DNA or RNA helicase